MVSGKVLDSLRAARGAGYTLSIASGRPLCLITDAVLESGVMDFAVCSNGASVVRLPSGESVQRRLLAREDALDCHAMLASFKPAWNAFFNNSAYFEWKGASYMLTGRTGAAARARRYGNGGGNAVHRLLQKARKGLRFAIRLFGRSGHQVVSVRRHLMKAHEGVEKMGCTILDAADCARAANMLREDGRFEVASMGSTELEITARGVTKGTGVQALMAFVGMDQEGTVAFGDGGNDLPLADVVGRFVAMENGDAEVREAAFEVCPSVADDGVAEWINSMLASGGLKEGVRYV